MGISSHQSYKHFTKLSYWSKFKWEVLCRFRAWNWCIPALDLSRVVPCAARRDADCYCEFSAIDGDCRWRDEEIGTATLIVRHCLQLHSSSRHQDVTSQMLSWSLGLYSSIYYNVTLYLFDIVASYTLVHVPKMWRHRWYYFGLSADPPVHTTIMWSHSLSIH